MEFQKVLDNFQPQDIIIFSSTLVLAFAILLYSRCRKVKHHRVLVLMGPKGTGKSSTGNTLFDLDVFPVAHTEFEKQTKFKTIEELTIVDFPGTKYKSKDVKSKSEEILTSFIMNKDVFANKKIDAFFLCIRINEGEPEYLNEAVQEFFQVFDVKGLRSLILLLIHDTKSPELIKQVMSTPIYKEMQQKIRRNIPVCIWSNKKPLEKQRDNLDQALRDIDAFDFTETIVKHNPPTQSHQRHNREFINTKQPRRIGWGTFFLLLTTIQFVIIPAYVLYPFRVPDTEMNKTTEALTIVTELLGDSSFPISQTVRLSTYLRTMNLLTSKMNENFTSLSKEFDFKDSAFQQSILTPTNNLINKLNAVNAGSFKTFCEQNSQDIQNLNTSIEKFYHINELKELISKSFLYSSEYRKLLIFPVAHAILLNDLCSSKPNLDLINSFITGITITLDSLTSWLINGFTENQPVIAEVVHKIIENNVKASVNEIISILEKKYNYRIWYLNRFFHSSKEFFIQSLKYLNQTDSACGTIFLPNINQKSWLVAFFEKPEITEPNEISKLMQTELHSTFEFEKFLYDSTDSNNHICFVVLSISQVNTNPFDHKKVINVIDGQMTTSGSESMSNSYKFWVIGLSSRKRSTKCQTDTN